MSAAEYVTNPVMHGLGALVVEPFGFIIPPAGGSMLSIGAGPDPADSRRGILYVGITSQSGQMLTALIGEKNLPAVADLLSHAAERIRRLDFEAPPVGGRA